MEFFFKKKEKIFVNKKKRVDIISDFMKIDAGLILWCLYKLNLWTMTEAMDQLNTAGWYSYREKVTLLCIVVDMLSL